MHIITGLEIGGAERQLERIVTSVAGSHRVICLGHQGPIGRKLEDAGVSVVPLEMKGSGTWARGLIRIRRHVREFQADAVQGWMYHGNLAAVAGAFGTQVPIFWNIRHSVHDLAQEMPRTRSAIRASVHVSGRPERIVYNSEVAASQHEALGYPAEARKVIPNGFDTAALRADPERRHMMRARLGIPMEAPVVGMIARYHPMKNHTGFLQIAALVATRMPEAQFILAGRGVDVGKPELATLISAPALQNRVHFIGECSDVVALYSALDVLCVPSVWGEAFPNVVGEAMACSVPCVVTDVGDSAAVVGDTGLVVRPGDSNPMVEAILVLLRDPSYIKRLGLAARRRMECHYDLDRVAKIYRGLWAGEAWSDSPSDSFIGN